MNVALRWREEDCPDWLPAARDATLLSGFAKKTVINDLRGMFGQNKDGGRVAIKNFAPRMGLDLEHLPFPAEAKAEAYGVQRAKVLEAGR